MKFQRAARILQEKTNKIVNHNQNDASMNLDT